MSASATPDRPAKISVRGLRKSFGPKHVLNGVDGYNSRPPIVSTGGAWFSSPT